MRRRVRVAQEVSSRDALNCRKEDLQGTHLHPSCEVPGNEGMLREVYVGRPPEMRVSQQAVYAAFNVLQHNLYKIRVWKHSSMPIRMISASPGIRFKASIEDQELILDELRWKRFWRAASLRSRHV